jgi:hypothetical protein
LAAAEVLVVEDLAEEAERIRRIGAEASAAAAQEAIGNFWFQTISNLKVLYHSSYFLFSIFYFLLPPVHLLLANIILNGKNILMPTMCRAVLKYMI